MYWRKAWKKIPDLRKIVSKEPPVLFHQFSSVAQSCPTLCNPMDCSMPGFPVHHNSRSLLKLMSIESAMPSNQPILYHLLLFLPSIFPSIRVFSNESVLHIRWPKYWSFSFFISPSNEYLRLISIRMDWFDLLAVQGTVESLLQHHSSKASVLLCSAFFRVQISHLYMTTGKTVALIIWTFVGKVMSLPFNTLSRLIIAFLPRSKHILILWLLSLSTLILEPRNIKSATIFTFYPSICHKRMGPNAMILVFWMLSFKPAFSSPPLSPSSRDSLVPLHFLPLEWYHLHIWGCWHFSWQSWF